MASLAITVTVLAAVLAFPAPAGLKPYEGTSGLRDPVIGRDGEVLLSLPSSWSSWRPSMRSSAPGRRCWVRGVRPRWHGHLESRQEGSAPVGRRHYGGQRDRARLSECFRNRADHGASHAAAVAIPSAQWFIGATLGALIVVARLTTMPARIGARRPVIEVPQSELA